MRRRGSKSRQIIFYLLNRKANTRLAANNRSLCIALVFAIFFALMIILQMVSVETNTNSLGDTVANDGIFGRFRFFGKRNDEKEIIFPPKVAQELERIISDTEYSVDSLASVTNDSNQSNDIWLHHELTHRDHWQEVSHSRHKFYVFSAYYDDRNAKNPYIRVIAATKTRTDEKVYCKLWFAHTYRPSVVNAVNRVIRENWNLKYSAYFILCPLLYGSPVPDAVSILVRDQDINNNKVNEDYFMPSNRLLVHNRPQIRSKANNKMFAQNIAVCVKPLHYEFNKVLNLIEFIEMNRILGVNHFVLYNHTVGPDVDCVLQEYIDLGLITMLPWNLNMVSQKEIRTEGLFAALNDCLYRTMNRFKYVLMIDIDELIIPHQHKDIPSMLKSMPRGHGHRVGAYSFRNAFFYTQWPDDQTMANQIDYPLLTLLKTRRKSQLNIHKQRSKCIVIPENVIEMGNHFVWEFVPKKGMVNIDPKMGVLHHYRVCEFGGNDCVNSHSVVDRRVHFWKDNLIGRVKERVEKWSHFCNIINKTIS